MRMLLIFQTAFDFKERNILPWEESKDHSHCSNAVVAITIVYSLNLKV